MIPSSGRGRLIASLTLSVVAIAALAGPAHGEPPAPSIHVELTICLPPLPLPLLPCDQGTPPSEQGEPKPGAVTPSEPRYDPRRIIVDFKRRETRETIERVWKRAGVKPERTLKKVGLYVVRAPADKRDEALAALERSAAVKDVERELLIDGLDTTPTDPDWPDQWGLRRAGFPAAWDVTHGSRSVIVAVIDTGVDASHPELKDALVPGRDIVNADNDPSDDNGHGTAVAGVVAARANNGTGVAGACWNCSIMPVKVLGADGAGTTADVAAGIIWAADHGARVINLSLGAPGTTEALSAAVAYALGKDAVIVAAAGNSSSVTPFYPAAAPNVIGVAATNESDRLYSWSNRGAWVEVAAPGCNSAPWPNDGYVGFCGTSAAAPLVAGVAGLVRSAWPQATAAQTAAAVEDSVDGVGPDVSRGRINAALALTRVSPTRSSGRQTNTFVGRLARRHRTRSHQQLVGSGQLTAVLRFSGARRLAMILRQPGRSGVRVSGRSPLRVSRSVVSGTITVIVQGKGARASYRLTVSSPMPGGS
jgi:subtilase family protein